MDETTREQCDWFALCTNTSDGYVKHPVLGFVPTCRRCADKLELGLPQQSARDAEAK